MRKKLKEIFLKVFIILYVVSIIGFIFCLPDPLFNDPYSIVVLDKNDNLLGVKISDDGQWRFPETDNVTDKFRTCITVYEDKRFFDHIGVDFLAVCRAIKQNFSNSKVVSGASTISMQTIRLSRKDKDRNFYQKIIESIMAIRMEFSFSKEEILNIYASHAPFGGNIVGIDAASWRYFGRTPEKLSWAENAMLAVLPNSPSMIHTARNRDKLKVKRNDLLRKLCNLKYISETELELALEEEIPEHPKPYPMYAYHFVNKVAKDSYGTGKDVKTTLNLNYQKQINEIIYRYNQQYIQNEINNIACLVLEVETGNVVTYIGNGDFSSDLPERAVDMVVANRSTGSLLKPFLYAAMLSGGDILPKTLIKDVPTRMGNFSPENFDRQYDGAVHVDEALARSLNIPFVYMLQDYGILKFLYVLKRLDLSTIDKSSEYYGLSLILGGGESNLWDLCSAYASMARSLKNFNENNSKYNLSDYHKANYIFSDEVVENIPVLRNTNFFTAASIWFTFEAMTSLSRPGSEKQWQSFSSRQKVAWKTGTSFGFKDAWSIAVTPEYVIGIWVGNATGEGKAGITGLKVAAPVLFEVLNVLPDYDNWFDIPYDELIKAKTCRESGCLAGQYCDINDSLWIPSSGMNSNICPYHRQIMLDASGNFRVNSNCYPVENMISSSWFVLPPLMESYYKIKNSWYKTLPPIMLGCDEYSLYNDIMEIIYPNQLSKVYIPIDLQGDTLSSVFKIAHRDNDAVIYWYIDEKYIGNTKDYHEKAIKLPPGNYALNLMDNKGNKLSRIFTVVSRIR